MRPLLLFLALCLGCNTGHASAPPDASSTPVTVRAVSVATSRFHGCAALSDGRLACWGKNENAQITSPARVALPVTVGVQGLLDVQSVATGDAFTCALRKNGSVFCWGWIFGEQGKPTVIAGLRHVKQLTARESLACALEQDGSVACFGLFEQEDPGTKLEAQPVKGVSGIVQLAQGGDGSACGVKDNGDVWCWGSNRIVLPGSTDAEQRWLPPVQVKGLGPARAVSMGHGHACVILRDGSARCWGSNEGGRSGQGDKPIRELQGAPSLVQIAAGDSHTCGLTQEGRVLCWGEHSNGQLGVDYESVKTLPAPVGGLRDVVALSAAELHTCALTQQGRVFCWGRNDDGQLGDGVSPVVLIPRKTAIRGATHLALGRSTSCAAMKSGDVKCWGFPAVRDDSPVTLSAINRTTQMDSSQVVTCAVTERGMPACFYMADRYAFPSGEPARPPFRRAVVESEVVPTLSGVKRVAVDRLNSLYAIRNSGDVVARFHDVEQPRWSALKGTKGAVALAALSHGVCVLLESGRVACAHDDRFERDEDEPDDAPLKPPPSAVTPVEGVTDAKAIAAGQNHACVIGKDGQVKCWGSLGFARMLHWKKPTVVPELAGAQQITSNHFHVCALRNGEVLCLGDNRWGQLGDGTFQERTTAIRVPMKVRAVAVEAGYEHTCAIDETADVWCWGRNSDGQVGGRASWQLNPVEVALPR